MLPHKSQDGGAGAAVVLGLWSIPLQGRDGGAGHAVTCLFSRLEESCLVPAGFLTAHVLQET